MRIETQRQHIRGFTLIESLVYFALLVIISTGAVTFLFSLEELFQQYRVQQELFSSATFTMDRILSDIRTGDSIDLAGSVIASTTEGVLAIDSGTNVTTYDWNGGAIEVDVDGVDQGALTSSAVTVDRFTVYHYPTAQGETVRFELRLSAAVGDHSGSATFHGGSEVRGSYDN